MTKLIALVAIFRTRPKTNTSNNTIVLRVNSYFSLTASAWRWKSHIPSKRREKISQHMSVTAHNMKTLNNMAPPRTTLQPVTHLINKTQAGLRHDEQRLYTKCVVQRRQRFGDAAATDCSLPAWCDSCNGFVRAETRSCILCVTDISWSFCLQHAFTTSPAKSGEGALTAQWNNVQ